MTPTEHGPREITLTLTGRAVPWKSPKVVARPGMAHPMAIKDRTVKEWQAYVRIAAAEAAQGEPLRGALFGEIAFYMAQPGTWPQWKRRAAEAQLIRPTKRPDSSNLLKALEDGLEGPCFANDCQLTDHRIARRYAAWGSPERVEILLREVACGHDATKAQVIAFFGELHAKTILDGKAIRLDTPGGPAIIGDDPFRGPTPPEARQAIDSFAQHLRASTYGGAI